MAAGDDGRIRMRRGEEPLFLDDAVFKEPPAQQGVFRRRKAMAGRQFQLNVGGMIDAHRRYYADGAAIAFSMRQIGTSTPDFVFAGMSATLR